MLTVKVMQAQAKEQQEVFTKTQLIMDAQENIQRTLKIQGDNGSI